MAIPILKYTHHSIGKKYVKSGPKRAELRQHSRTILLMNHIKTNSQITYDDMHKMSFNNPEMTLQRFTKRYDTKFIYIGNDTWRIDGVVNHKIKPKRVVYVKARLHGLEYVKRKTVFKKRKKRTYKTFGIRIHDGSPKRVV